MEQADETTITEITIQPDGRIYVFGASRQVLAVLSDLCPGDQTLLQRLASSRSGAHELAKLTSPQTTTVTAP
jgi:hypothetical protein